MSEEPVSYTGRFVALLVAVAVGGSAVAVVGWHLLFKRDVSKLDTSGFDIRAAPDNSLRRAQGLDRRAARSAAAPTPESSSLGMVKSGAGLRVVSPGSPNSRPGAATARQKEKAARSLKAAAIKHEKFFDGLGRRMEAKYPSLTQYGKDWVSYPDLRALRDQYWRDRDPIKFAYGMVKSDNFGKLLKKYSNDPGVRAFLTETIKQAPADLRSAVGQVFQSDYVAKGLVNTVTKSLGLPPGLTSFLGVTGRENAF